MFRIVLTANEYGSHTYTEQIGELYENEFRAISSLIDIVNNEVKSFNGPDAYNLPPKIIAEADFINNHTAIVRLWDSEGYWENSYYDICEIVEKIEDFLYEYRGYIITKTDNGYDIVLPLCINNSTLYQKIESIKYFTEALSIIDEIVSKEIKPKPLNSMYLVYEKNYLTYSDVDIVDEDELSLWPDYYNAYKDMHNRKTLYMSDHDNGFTYMEKESSNNCLVFADNLSKDSSCREGEFHICIKKIKIGKKE